jgi:phosphoglycerate dehydrogenase-like enzyme
MIASPLKIVFHGTNAAQFRPGLENLIGSTHSIELLDDDLSEPNSIERFEQADVVVGIRLNAQMPRLRRLKLYHAPAAGTDAIDTSLLPAGSSLCNCFGHEQAIAEYVFAALLSRHVPLARADADLRQQRWTYWAGAPNALRTELGAQTLGIVGLGHIGSTLAQRARAFGMRVHGCNRSKRQTDAVDQIWPLDRLPEFMASVDAAVITLPLTEDTRSLVDHRALAALRPHAVLINVGRGPVVDEQALFNALQSRQIGGAVIDTWYQYPGPGQTSGAPSRLDFASLDNVLMTPHMSGWTRGTVERRQQTLAENISRLVEGRPLINQLRGPVHPA